MSVTYKSLEGHWQRTEPQPPHAFRCGHCDDRVASAQGWSATRADTSAEGCIYLCPSCNQPTYIRRYPIPLQVPNSREGDGVKHLPDDVAALYNEAREAHTSGAHTASALTLRKLLMHVAVEKKATEGKNFIEYVEYLDDEKYLGRGGKEWVDLIRTRSNDANHEIVLMEAEDSKQLLKLAEMLLKLVYEFPGSLPQTGDEGPGAS